MWVQIPALFAKKVVAQPSFEGCASTFLTKIPKKSFKKKIFLSKKNVFGPKCGENAEKSRMERQSEGLRLPFPLARKKLCYPLP
jgi:hypothetical protein